MLILVEAILFGGDGHGSGGCRGIRLTDTGAG